MNKRKERLTEKVFIGTLEETDEFLLKNDIEILKLTASNVSVENNTQIYIYIEYCLGRGDINKLIVCPLKEYAPYYGYDFIRKYGQAVILNGEYYVLYLQIYLNSREMYPYYD